MSERVSDLEAKIHLEAIYDQLSRLVGLKECDLAEIMFLRRMRIQEHFQVLGLSGLEDYAALEAITKRIRIRNTDLQVPVGYPSMETFTGNLQVVYNTRNEQGLESMPKELSLVDVAKHCRIDWGDLQNSGGLFVADYLYNLGIIMTKEPAYTTIFNDDLIVMNDNWFVEKGKYRALTMRILGSMYIKDHGLCEWIKVRKI